MAYWRLFALYLRLGVLAELEYRANFWIQLLEAVLSLIVALGGLAVVFTHTAALDQWLPAQLVVLVGIHLLLDGVISFVISPSLGKFTGDVRSGSFDFVLLKPVDAQFVASVQKIELWKLVNIVLGAGVIAVGLLELGSSVGWRAVVLFGALLLVGTLIIYSFWLILATTSFWIVRAENIFEVFNALFVAGRWPVTIYPGWLRMLLTFVVPVAFAVTVPAQGLIGSLRTGDLLLALGVAAGLLVVARWFWRYGVRNYAGASA